MSDSEHSDAGLSAQMRTITGQPLLFKASLFFLFPSSFNGKSNTSHEMKMLSKRSALHVSVLLAGRREAQQTQARGAATEYQSKAQIVSRSIKSPTASGTEEKI